MRSLRNMDEKMTLVDGALIRDQNGDTPGQYGDSCFDTSAYALSKMLLGESMVDIKLAQFIRPDGETIRHPKSFWGAEDQSEDQEKPLSMAVKFAGLTYMGKSDWRLIKEKIYERGMKTGNGNFITLGYLAELQELQWLRIFCQVIQVLFFWFPFCWNDGTKNIDWSWHKSDGYLQWALTACFTPWIFRKLIRKQTLKQKIADYYAPEGQNGLWVVQKHYQLIDKYF
jgi:hypothetical protein